MTMSFQPVGGLVVVPAELLGPGRDIRIRPAPDTGAAPPVISWDALMQVDYDPTPRPERIPTTTAGGVQLAPRLRVARLATPGQHRANLVVLGHRLPAAARVDGLLALSVFHGLGLTIDYRAGLLTLD